VALAAESDVAVVVVGTNEEVECEGVDRDSLALPGRQDELVARVAAVNPRTVVVVNAGAPVLLPWADSVPALLLAWFPGQEFGHALADVLLGRREPGGRLPTTWPASEDGLPSTRPEAGVLAYAEGLAVGHRAGLPARFPFGHGLGYGAWEYTGIEAAAGGPGEDVVVRVRIANRGERPAREVVQVYASRPQSAVNRPVRWLAGFAAVELGPGEEGEVAVTVAARSLAHWDAGAHAWKTEPGVVRLDAGRSSGDLRQAAEVTLPGG
jgi:beta-glucosidase